MTTAALDPPYPIHGPVAEERWGTIGFRLSDKRAAQGCRSAARWMVTSWRLDWIPDLNWVVGGVVSELVTNVLAHAKPNYHSGSVTLWHPNRWLHITVHDKDPYQPWAELRRGFPAWHALRGRGLPTVQRLIEPFCGELDFAQDFDRAFPGKVTRVRLLLPDVEWGTPPPSPWTGRAAELPV